MNNHTQGPWTADEGSVHARNGHVLIADFYWTDAANMARERNANAALCQALLDAGNTFDGLQRAIELAEAAILKAVK